MSVAAWHALFFGVAFALLFLYAALEGLKASLWPHRKWMTPLGLALFVFVFFVDALRELT